MLPADRKMAILRLVRQNGSVRVAELAEMFSVTEETIRRDLDQLEQEGHVRRTYGGAVSTRPTGFEAPILEREGTNAEAKRRIGQAAVALLSPGDTCMLDASTTALAMARQIPAMNLTVVTNSIPIMTVLAGRESVTVVGTGGMLRANSLSFVGPQAEEVLARYHVDKVFLSCVGFHLERGLTDSNLLEVEVKKQMIAAGREIIALVDSSKWGQVAFAQFAATSAIHKVVTDADAPEDMVAALRERGVEVIVAG